MRTPIHRYTEKWTKEPLKYYLRFRDLLLIDKNHEKLTKILERPQSRLVNPDSMKMLTHPVSTHLMLLPHTRRKLIDELEYQHANAATPANMVAEYPANYETYATDLYSKDEQKTQILEMAAKKHPRWMEEARIKMMKDKSEARLAAMKLEAKAETYPHLAVRGVIRLQVEAIQQCEQASGAKVL